eukprot:PhF_6_TR25629/c4_g1_i2/m.36012
MDRTPLGSMSTNGVGQSPSSISKPRKMTEVLAPLDFTQTHNSSCETNNNNNNNNLTNNATPVLPSTNLSTSAPSTPRTPVPPGELPPTDRFLGRSRSFRTPVVTPRESPASTPRFGSVSSTASFTTTQQSVHNTQETQSFFLASSFMTPRGVPEP